jgi:hypothetical protein
VRGSHSFLPLPTPVFIYIQPNRERPETFEATISTIFGIWTGLDESDAAPVSHVPDLQTSPMY